MVNSDGSVLMDEYVQPQEAVTDYRTAVSGILPSHLKEGAISMQEAQQQVANVLKGRILVGHSVHHDLQVCVLPCLHSVYVLVPVDFSALILGCVA